MNTLRFADPSRPPAPEGGGADPPFVIKGSMARELQASHFMNKRIAPPSRWREKNRTTRQHHRGGDGPGAIRIGTSGWIYKHWRKQFYPKDLPPRQWFAYYAQHYDTVEINNTFYRLPSESAFDAWRQQAPAGFVYAVKASRFLTHMKKLNEPEEPIERILGRARRLGPTLGPVLYQLPRGWKCKLDRLAHFFAALPRDIQHVMEYRGPEWLSENVVALMRRYQIGLCIHDLIADHPLLVTSNVVYVRFHGAGVKYGGSYSKRRLGSWSEWMSEQAASGRRVFAYFNNDAEAHAVRNAQTLRAMVVAGER
jgi:uncharacterized protein YecE (DUF72 family)